MPINVKLDLDDRQARQQVEKFRKQAGQPIKTAVDAGQAGPQSYAAVQRRRMEEKRQEQKKREVYQNAQQAAQQAQSGEEEFLRGGFYNAAKDKIDALKRTRDMFRRDKDKDNRGAESEGAGGGPDALQSAANAGGGMFGRLFGEKNAKKNKPIQRLYVQNAVFRNARGLGGSGSGSGSGSESGGGGKPGGTMSGMGKAAPYIGIAFAVAGALVKAISAMGEKRSNARMSQQQSLKAIGLTNYQGGLFHHAEAGMANLEFLKQSGMRRGYKLTHSSSRGGDPNALSFAASQGLGASEFASTLGKLRYGGMDMKTMEFVRYMKAANVQNLRQGEYLQEIAGHTKGMRDQGYGAMDKTEMKNFLGLAAQMSSTQSSNGSTASRGLEIAKAVDKSIRGADKGGPLGSLVLSQLMASGMDPLEAYMQAEQGMGNEQNRKIAEKFRKEMFGGNKFAQGIAFRNWGLTSSVNEGANIRFDKASPAGSAKIPVNSMRSIELRNKTEMAYATSPTAAKAMEISHDAQMQMLDLMKKMEPNLRPIADGIHKAESALFEFVNEAVPVMGKLVETIKDVGDGLADFLG
ncbi:MAG TPA: hypothetical protein DEA96_09680 [Leptospiraceae bacterium]|nr:hypothetical protein [Spirochaetaceae bacterium]HBS05224.1 hypothetical protein [Leptospiraceae bacterium]|tara:strand:+ start:5046 stop:6776 length:1731 start_codon:yes stop_codon:yes gene_type:complete